MAVLASATTTMPQALWSDDRTVLNLAAGAQELGRFSCADSGNAKEDKGSGGCNGHDRSPNDRGSGEERDNGSTLPATMVNSLDSPTHAYQRRREGGGGGMTQRRRTTTVMTTALSRNHTEWGGGGR